jgi:hypothetical protein
VNRVMNVWVSKKAGKFLNICTTGGFLRRDQVHEVSVRFGVSNMYIRNNGSFFLINRA